MGKYQCANCGYEAQKRQTCCGQPMRAVSEEDEHKKQTKPKNKAKK